MVEGATAHGSAAAAARVVPYGAPAVEALIAAVGAAKSTDPLAPVTVIVPSALAAITVRRRLAGRTGIIAVDTVVLPGLATRLAGTRLATDGRQPITGLQSAALARAVLAHERARLTSAADHPATVDALLRTFAELRPLDPADLARLSASGARAAEVVDLFRSYRRAAKHWMDDHDAVELAVEAVRTHDPVLDEVGTVVLFLPRRLGAADMSLLAALHEQARLRVVIGTTGRHRADEPQRHIVDQLTSIGVDVEEPSPAVQVPTPALPSLMQIVRAADPAEEARVATRRVIDRLAAGVPADRIAIVSRVQSPYALVVHEELAAAGIPHSAPGPMQLGQSIAGRALLGLLAWPVDGHRRDDLMRLLRGTSLRDPGGGRARPDRWDRIARDAGVVSGLDQWRQRLDAARDQVVARIATHREMVHEPTLPLTDPSAVDDESSPTVGWQRRVIEIDALRAFLDRLAGDTDPGDRRSWAALSRWARDLLRTYLGSDAAAAGWSEPEQRSRAAVFDLLDDLATLDGLDPAPGPDSFRRVVTHELSRAAGRVGRFGHGVFVGRLVEAVGADLDEVIVLGCAEGVFPPRAADDPLLPDRDRRAVSAVLRRRGNTPAEEERDVLAVMAAGPACALTFPVADSRGQRTRQPSSFVLEQCSVLLGERVDTQSVMRLRGDGRASTWFCDLPSFEWWLAEGGAPATATELDVRELLAARAAGQPVEALPVVHAARLERGLVSARARIEGEFGVWSGAVGRWAELADDLQHPRSATSLQRWATCPFRYFLGNVLELEGLEDPGEAETISAADRGTLVHTVLERYFRARIEGEPVDIDEIADEIEARFRRQGRTGRQLLWDADWSALRRHLTHILEAGAVDPDLVGVEPVAVEYRFGFTDAETGETVEPVAVDIGNGRRMRFRGAIDRIDRSPDGSRLVVLDYKTGSARGYDVVDPRHEQHDIVARGTLLQLPVYAAAAREAYPGATEAEAYYWFVGQRGAIERRGGPIDDEAQERFRTVMRTIADGIEGGVFPARPGDEEWRPYVGQTHQNCMYCDYDKLCPSGRGEQWVRLRQHDELRDYVELAERLGEEESEA
ncbi:MAG TPA: PD-(D/E)XK nuclease family protein [Acidimicrobiales bacterium]|nr:PD-(D/E)XK nuclease family protein [Acidimicrobiales bacterium]